MDPYAEWDSDTDTGTDSSEYDSYDDSDTTLPDRAELYRIPLQQRNIAAAEGYTPQARQQQYAPFDLSGVDTTVSSYPAQGTTRFQTEVQQVASLITIDSQHRDGSVYPQPTEFSITLPREYRNVTGINFAQIKLINSFYYFRNSKFNTYFNLREEGRDTYEIRIREGSYNINTLITELLQQLNTSPPFYAFKNGFEDFVTLFGGTGDLFVGFNYPGDYFYDAVNRAFIGNPTIDYIVRRYFSQRYVQLNTYTNQTDILNVYKVGYYYPPLKEAFLDPTNPTFNKTYPGMTPQQVYYRVINNLQNMTDPVIVALIDQNIPFLETYRATKTFTNAPVNKYAISLSSNQNRITIQSDTLNTSIIRDIDNQVVYATNIALNENNTTAQEFNQQKTRIDSMYYILSQMYNYYQSKLATTFAINYGTFTIADLSNSSTILRLQNGSALTSVFTSPTPAYITAAAQGQIEKSPNYISRPTRDASNHWPPTLQTLATPTYDPANYNMGPRNRPYDFTRDEPVFDTQFVDPTSGTIYTNPRTSAGDIVTNISATKYTIFKFTSPVRQTLEVETLPRPYFYRYEAANEQTPAALFFDLSYSWTPVPSLVIPPQTNTLNGDDDELYTLTITNPSTSFVFVAPTMNEPGKYPLNITVAPLVPFAANFKYAIYHDRESFIADVTASTISPQRAIRAIDVSAGQSSITAPLTVIGGDTYYIIFKSTSISFPNTTFQLTAVQPPEPEPIVFVDDLEGDLLQEPIPLPYQDPGLALSRRPTTNFNFVKVNDADWTRLPDIATQSPADKLYNRTYMLTAQSKPFMGYDDAGISTDMTHYKSFKEDEDGIVYAMDPISKYQFQKVVGYSASNQSYIYAGSTNAILDETNNAPYTPVIAATKMRQSTIVHWPDTHFVPPQDATVVPSQPAFATTAPFTQAVADLSLTYTYVARPDISAASPSLSLGGFISGFTFSPTNGIWDVNRFTFKSAYSSPDGPNEAIASIGIYPVTQIAKKSLSEVRLSDALVALSSYKKAYYNTPADVIVNDGFDSNYGAWYEFVRTETPRGQVLGYTPSAPDTYDTRPDIYYLIVPFNASGEVTQFYMPTGSLTPDPASQVTVVGGPSSQTIVPASPPTRTSQYEQSMPICTQGLAYQTNLTTFEDETSMYDYSPWASYMNIEFPGRIDFLLRSSSYTEAARNYLLFGGTAADESRADIYEIRLREYPQSRDTIFVGNIDLEDLIPSGGVFITWAATSSAIYILTADASSPTTLDIYKVTNIIGGPTAAYLSTIIAPAGVSEAQLYIDAAERPIVVAGTTIMTATFQITRPSLLSATVNSATSTLHILETTATPGERLVISYNTGDLSLTPQETTIPAVFGDGIISIKAAQDGTAYLLSTNYPNRWLRLLTNGDVVVSSASFTNPLGVIDMSRVSWDIAENGATWFHVCTSTNYQEWMQWRITGNLQTGSDLHKGLELAWQLFYPTMKVVLTKLANTYNAITDLEDIQYTDSSASNPPYGEFGHSLMFFYDSSAALLTDLSGTAPGTYKWGHESNYTQADISMSGYYNGAYLPALRLAPGHEYYLALRGYSPSENFQCMTRFRLPNRYDYGFTSIAELISDISAATSLTPINPEYRTSLQTYNSAFIGKPITIPSDILNRAAIFDLSFNDFADFYVKFCQLNNDYLTAKQLVTTITDSTSIAVDRYIRDNYAAVLPAYYFERSDTKASLNFNLLFGSSVHPSLATAPDNWGLGYNLGFYKHDYICPGDDIIAERYENRFTTSLAATTDCSGGATIFRAPNFFRILDEYIYLRMNREFGFNRVDSTAQENLKRIQDTTGEVATYHAKLLLGPFGSYSTVMIYSPIQLNPSMSRLDKLTFQWTDSQGNILDNNNAEWSAVVYITERQNRATLDSTWVATR